VDVRPFPSLLSPPELTFLLLPVASIPLPTPTSPSSLPLPQTPGPVRLKIRVSERFRPQIGNRHLPNFPRQAVGAARFFRSGLVPG
jgi:hypothetical protein